LNNLDLEFEIPKTMIFVEIFRPPIPQLRNTDDEGHVRRPGNGLGGWPYGLLHSDGANRFGAGGADMR